jgi:hypothetical protein
MISLDYLYSTLPLCKHTPYNLHAINTISKYCYISQAFPVHAPIPVTLAPENMMHGNVLSYQENEIITDMPGMLMEVSQDIYMYGFKNPDSFIKSVLLATRPEFIIKSRTDRTNIIHAFKIDLIKYIAGDPVNQPLVAQLKANEHINCDGDLVHIIARHCEISIFIVDIVRNSYVDIAINGGDKYIICVKDINSTYMPVLLKHITGAHIFTGDQIAKLKGPTPLIPDLALQRQLYHETPAIPSIDSPLPSGILPPSLSPIGSVPISTLPSSPWTTSTLPPSILPSSPIADGSMPNGREADRQEADRQEADGGVVDERVGMSMSVFNPSKEYKLRELQVLAEQAGITLVKAGKTLATIHKTRADLYADLRGHHIAVDGAAASNAGAKSPSYLELCAIARELGIPTTSISPDGRITPRKKAELHLAISLANAAAAKQVN